MLTKAQLTASLTQRPCPNYFILCTAWIMQWLYITSHSMLCYTYIRMYMYRKISIECIIDVIHHFVNSFLTCTYVFTIVLPQYDFCYSWSQYAYMYVQWMHTQFMHMHTIPHSGKRWQEKILANLVNWWPNEVFSLKFMEYSISVFYL